MASSYKSRGKSPEISQKTPKTKFPKFRKEDKAADYDKYAGKGKGTPVQDEDRDS